VPKFFFKRNVDPKIFPTLLNTVVSKPNHQTLVQDPFYLVTVMSSFINDVTAWRYEDFCDDTSKDLVVKYRYYLGFVVKHNLKLCDVIYGRQ
jgi:hypothetical protein